uniref:Uncharacterized protein n=1 Tax=viral metagenome TaxID=1070528 RepID=A0A6C0I8L3_9ZZZZ
MTKKSKETPEAKQKREAEQAKKNNLILIDNIMSLISSSILCFIIPILIIHFVIVAVIKIVLGETNTLPQTKEILDIAYSKALCVDNLNIVDPLKGVIKSQYNTMISKIISIANNFLEMELSTLPFSITIEQGNLEAIVKNIGNIGEQIPKSDKVAIRTTFDKPNEKCSTEVKSLPDLINVIDIQDLMSKIPGLEGVNLNDLPSLADAHKGITEEANKSFDNFGFKDAISKDGPNPFNNQELVAQMKMLKPQ